MGENGTGAVVAFNQKGGHRAARQTRYATRVPTAYTMCSLASAFLLLTVMRHFKNRLTECIQRDEPHLILCIIFKFLILTDTLFPIVVLYRINTSNRLNLNSVLSLNLVFTFPRFPETLYNKQVSVIYHFICSRFRFKI